MQNTRVFGRTGQIYEDKVRPSLPGADLLLEADELDILLSDITV